MEGSQYTFSDVETLLGVAASQCIFCVKKQLGDSGHLVQKRLREAIYFYDNNEEKFVVACFCKQGPQASRSHYHCPMCNSTIITRSSNFLKHLRDTHGAASTKKRETSATYMKRRKHTNDDDTENLKSKSVKIECPHCSSSFTTTKNLKRHIRDIHSIDTNPMICVDIVNGLYVTPKHEHSPVVPIHVVKSTNPPKIDCEEDNCRKFMQIAWSSGNPGKECIHLERTKHAKQYVKPAILKSDSLQDMLSKGLMSSDWGVKCEEMDNAAKNCGADSVFPVSFGDEGHSQRWFFFSVFTNEADSWCQFRRTRVTFDAVAGKWHCQCKGSGKSHRCIHRMMAMWWIFQESPLMAMSDVQAEDIDDLESHMLDSGTSFVTQSISTQQICQMTEYLYTQKRIPSLQQLPLKLRTEEETPPPCFFPKESTCPYCPGPTYPELCPSEVVTTQATVYGINYVKKGISVAQKKCPTCGNIVRFQDYASGFHNFNNSVLLTLPLCELLLSGLANKTTSGRMMDTLSLFNENRYHHQTVRKAFHHFLSLTDFKFDFYCYQCGHHPPVVVADANWKLAFDIPLGTFKRPDPETISDKDLEIDIVKTWSDLDKSVIAEGLISGTAVANPYTKSTRHSTLAPWMGQHTRLANTLPKTEVKKALQRRPDSTTQPTKKIDEDIILEIVESKKPNKKDLQDACLALGVSSEGSIADMMNRLQELLNFKDIYPKLFLKLQKAGGGILHFSCMHGVVYYVNFLFWTESARDHCDGLLSFKHFPTCYISDVAGQVARHTNNRTKQQFFLPHDGRLCVPSPDNLKKSAQKQLQVDMEWVKNLRSPLPQQTKGNIDRLTSPHPVTGTSERYSLYDRFHQKNQRRPEEKLRSINICHNLRKEVNTSVAEQFNRDGICQIFIVPNERITF